MPQVQLGAFKHRYLQGGSFQAGRVYTRDGLPVHVMRQYLSMGTISTTDHLHPIITLPTLDLPRKHIRIYAITSPTCKMTLHYLASFAAACHIYCSPFKLYVICNRLNRQGSNPVWNIRVTHVTKQLYSFATTCLPSGECFLARIIYYCIVCQCLHLTTWKCSLCFIFSTCTHHHHHHHWIILLFNYNTKDNKHWLPHDLTITNSRIAQTQIQSLG